MKIDELLNLGIKKLKNNNIAEPILKSKVLLSYLLNVPKENFIIHNSKEIEQEIEKIYFDNIEKLCDNLPIQYIKNSQEFMKMNFYVDENVLIPRADTEILVEVVLKLIKEDMHILDMCTGTGIIATSLAKYGVKTNIYASDINRKALDIAKMNANNNLENNNISFITSNMFENIDTRIKYDIIVSNPPYIETDVISTLDKEVQKEPIIALDGGKDGLDFYRIIADNAHKYLCTNGYLCLEIGYNQKDAIKQLLVNSGYQNINCIKDLQGNDRVIICELN